MSGENSLNTSCLTHYHTQASERSRQGRARLRTDTADTETGAVPFATHSYLSRLAEVPDSLPLWRCGPSLALSAVGDLPPYLIDTKFYRHCTTKNTEKSCGEEKSLSSQSVCEKSVVFSTVTPGFVWNVVKVRGGACGCYFLCPLYSLSHEGFSSKNISC